MKAIVTDDSKATRTILRKLMQDLNFEVEEAADGGELLDALTREIVDICLIDWNMPGMTGTEVIRVMKSHPAWKAIPSILITDESASERIDGALEAGASGYLGKPFNIEKLASILERLGLGE